MTDQQKRFIELAKKSEQMAKERDAVREELEAVMRQLDYGSTCQDPETGAVYKIVEPKGTFMYYRNVDYVRTSIGDERAGTLSKKEAESLGFVLKK